MLRLPPHTSIVIALHLLHSIGSRQTTTSTILIEDAWPYQHQHNTLINLLLSLSLSLWWSVGAKTRAPKPSPLPRGTGQLEHSHLQPHLHCYLHSYSYHQTCLWMHQDVMDHGQALFLATNSGLRLLKGWIFIRFVVDIIGDNEQEGRGGSGQQDRRTGLETWVILPINWRWYQLLN